MSDSALDAYARDRRPTLPQRMATEPEPEASFAEAYAAARTLQRVDNSDFQDRLTEKAYSPVVDALNRWRSANGRKPSFNTPNLGISALSDMRGVSNAYAGAIAARVGTEAAQSEIWAEVARIRSVDPDFLKGIAADHDTFWRQALENEQADRAASSAVLSRATGLAGFTARLAGSATKAMEDPLNIATLPFGGVGRTVAARVLTEGLANAAVELLSQPQAAENRALLGEELTGAEARANVAAAFIGGAAFQGLAEGSGALLRRAFRDQMTPDEVAASHVIDREAEIDAASPFVPQGEGPAVHRERLNAETERLVRPTPPTRPAPAMTQAQAIDFVIDRLEGGAARTVDTGGVTRFGISQRGNPDVNIEGLTRPEAVRLYRERYWTPLGLDGRDPQTALVAFDAAVNHGIGFARRILRQSGGDVLQMIQMRRAEYARLIAEAPERYGRFQRGWENRLRAVEQSIGLRPGERALTPDARAALDARAFDSDAEMRAAQAEIDAVTMERLAIEAAGDGVSRETSIADDFAARFDGEEQPLEFVEIRIDDPDISPEALPTREPVPGYEIINGPDGTPSPFDLRVNEDGSRSWLDRRADGRAAQRFGEFDPQSELADVQAKADGWRAYNEQASDMLDPPRDPAGDIEIEPAGMAITDWLKETLATPNWVVAPRLTPALKARGYDRAVPQPRYAELRQRWEAANGWRDGRPPMPEAARAEGDPRANDGQLGRFDDPAGAEIRAQAEGLTHDVRAAVEAGDLKGAAFDLDGDGKARSAQLVLDQLDEEDRAIAAVRACL